MCEDGWGCFAGKGGSFVMVEKAFEMFCGWGLWRKRSMRL